MSTPNDDHLTDVMSEIAAALGWCVGVLDGLGKPGDVPVWVRNALHKATRPLSAAEFERRMERRRVERDPPAPDPGPGGLRPVRKPPTRISGASS